MSAAAEDAIALLQKGDPQAALSMLQGAVRSDPASAEKRVFLFQLLSVLGDWDRALTQLNVAGEMDASTLAMVQTYRELLRCEALRAEVFNGERSPAVFGEPEEWIARCLQATRQFSSGDVEAAKASLEEGLQRAPLVAGEVDGTAFDWLCDGDSRLGPMLEAVVNGTYYWIPYYRIRSITLEKPVDLRDLVWAPAQFEWANEGQAVGFIPVRYAGTESTNDNSLLLSRSTAWSDLGNDIFLGKGQRTLMSQDEQFPLLECTQIKFHPLDQ